MLLLATRFRVRMLCNKVSQTTDTSWNQQQCYNRPKLISNPTEAYIFVTILLLCPVKGFSYHVNTWNCSHEPNGTQNFNPKHELTIFWLLLFSNYTNLNFNCVLPQWEVWVYLHKHIKSRKLLHGKWGRKSKLEKLNIVQN